jgi:hypothetical protein
MSGSAKLTSIDAVERLANGLRRFAEEASTALTDLEIEINRTLDWIKVDRKGFWENQVRRGWERLNEARLNLERCKMTAVGDQGRSCYDEKKALEVAKRRVHLAEEKVEAVRRWSRSIDRDFKQYRACVGQLSSWLQLDLVRLLGLLERMSGALEAYAQGGVGADSAPPDKPADAEPASETPGETAADQTAPKDAAS